MARTLLLTALLALATHPAWAQTPADILAPFDGLRLSTTWPTNTDYVTCNTIVLPATEIARINTPTAANTGVPLAFPPLEVRCQACNTWGCSSLSPNALRLFARELGDCDGNGIVNVSDLVCTNNRIFQSP